MEKRKSLIILSLVIAASIGIRLIPPLTNSFLVNFDSVYHARIAGIVEKTGWVPSWDPVSGGRPHLYPPAYHLLLGYTSMITGISVIEVTKYFLPIISSFIALSAFLLVRRLRSEESALFVAVMVAFNPILISQSYDSPQIFGFLLFPLIVYYLLKNQYLHSAGLLSLCLLFNYSAAILISLSIVLFSLLRYFFINRRREGIIISLLTILIALGLVSPWLIVTVSRSSMCFNPSTAVSPITGAGMGSLIIILPFALFIGIALIYLTRKRLDDYSLLWKTSLLLGLFGFALSIPLPQIHPFDQLLLFGFSLPFLIAEIPRISIRSRQIAIVSVFILGALISISMVHTVLSEDEISAARWVVESANGSVLANPEISSVINLLDSEKVEGGEKGIRTEFDLFLECIPDSERWTQMFEVLQTHNTSLAASSLEEYGIEYVVVGPWDVENYGFDIEKFGDMNLTLAFSSGRARVYRVGTWKGNGGCEEGQNG